MASAWFLVVAAVCGFIGMALIALSLPAHWAQVRGDESAPNGSSKTLRALGGGALILSLVACMNADHASMASLVWLMLLTASSLAVAFTLSWRPRWLRLLVAWVR
jgi:hypothetical protein